MSVGVFQPRVIALCCHYCAYSAADLAGSMRLEYATNVRIVKLMCTGKVDALLLMKAFEDGADAVFVAGCHEGDCHFLEGNLRASKQVDRAKKLLAEVGIEEDRLKMYHIGASDAPSFAAAANEMTEKARQLGPSSLKKDSVVL